MKKNNQEKHRKSWRKKLTTENTEIHGEKNKRKNIKSDNVKWISSLCTSVLSVVKKNSPRRTQRSTEKKIRNKN